MRNFSKLFMIAALLLSAHLACKRSTTRSTSAPSIKQSDFLLRVSAPGMRTLVESATPRESLIAWGNFGSGGSSGQGGNPPAMNSDFHLSGDMRFVTKDNKPQAATQERRDEFLRNLRDKVVALITETGGQTNNARETLDGKVLTGFTLDYVEGAATGTVSATAGKPKSAGPGATTTPSDPTPVEFIIIEHSTRQ